jgi:hypothetical protein
MQIHVREQPQHRRRYGAVLRLFRIPYVAEAASSFASASTGMPVGTASTGQAPACSSPWVTLPSSRPATRP